MVAIKLEAAPQYRHLDIKDRLFGYEILATVPAGPDDPPRVGNHYIVEVPDGQVKKLDARVKAGEILDYRPMKDDYRVLWLPPTKMQQRVLSTPGDTYRLHGLSDEVRARGSYGAGVVFGIVDTGLDRGHVAFEGKELHGDLEDSHGHGTHCASTGASGWGIASDAVIYMAAGLPNGSGTEATVGNAIRRVADFVASRRALGVLSLSLGGGVSGVIDDAVRYARLRGLVVVAAAGNDPAASIGSPARAADLIVLACDRSRRYADFTSGRGWTNPNRLVAAGVDIAAAARGTRNGVLVSSGTSMATPHVAGAVAVLLGAR